MIRLPSRSYLHLVSRVDRRSRPIDSRLMPLSCFKCYGPGHMQNGCENDTQCGQCAGSHNTRDCTVKFKKCPNCPLNCPGGQEHGAWSLECQHVSVQNMRNECTTWRRKDPTWRPKPQQETRSSSDSPHQDNSLFDVETQISLKRKTAVQAK